MFYLQKFCKFLFLAYLIFSGASVCVFFCFFCSDERFRKLAVDSMKHGNESVSNYFQVPQLKSRSDEVVRLSQFVLDRANTENSCIFVGQQAIGKSILSHAMVTLLREGLTDDDGDEIFRKTPAIYLPVGTDEDQFILNALVSYGIDTAMKSNYDVTSYDIFNLTGHVCREFDGPSVIVFDDITQRTQRSLLAKINDLTHDFRQNHPSTVVVLVTSDTTAADSTLIIGIFFCIFFYTSMRLILLGVQQKQNMCD